MKDKRRCLLCDKTIKGQHFNRKRCEPCAAFLRHKPKGTMTKAQIKKAKSMAGNVPRNEIAETLGVSLANLKRSCPDVKFATTWVHKMNPERTREVILYYFKYGKLATVKKYPEVNVKAIVDRPEYYGIKRQYRKTRWTESELLESVKMAGLVSLPAQAKHFNRPGANAGSIKALWVKRHKSAWAQVNGMVHSKARRLIKFHGTTYKYIKVVGTNRDGDIGRFGRRIMLWVDLEKSLKPELPDFIREGVKAMADFQRWLWSSEDPSPLIRKMIKEREFPA